MKEGKGADKQRGGEVDDEITATAAAAAAAATVAVAGGVGDGKKKTGGRW